MIELRQGKTRAVVHSERGGMVTSYEVGGKPVFYLDSATLAGSGRAEAVRVEPDAAAGVAVADAFALEDPRAAIVETVAVAVPATTAL